MIPVPSLSNLDIQVESDDSVGNLKSGKLSDEVELIICCSEVASASFKSFIDCTVSLSPLLGLLSVMNPLFAQSLQPFALEAQLTRNKASH